MNNRDKISVIVAIGIVVIIIVVGIKSKKSDYSAAQQAKTTVDSAHIVDSIAASKVRKKADSIGAITTRIAIKADSVAFAKWEKNTKAGRIHKKHPDWDTADCESVAKNLIWIGMTYEMVVCERGLPNHVTTSNYGEGDTYQACWYDYGTSCFYFGEDHIITSYN